MATYIKLASGIIQLDTPITSETISTALGYMPSNFSGDYNDLTNKPIDGDVLTSDQSVFYIADKNDNIIALIDSAGIHSVDVDVNGISVKETLSSLDTGVTSTENSLNSHKSNTTIHITAEEREKWNSDPLDSEDSELYITDNNGNILALFNADGLTITAIKTNTINGTDATDLATNTSVDNKVEKVAEQISDLNTSTITPIKNDVEQLKSDVDAIEVKTDNIEASESDAAFTITDDASNPIAQFDEAGLTVTAVKTGPITATTLNGTNIDALATTSYVDTEIAGLVNGAPEALDTLKELGDALAAHEDAYDALLETVGKKAEQSDLDNHTGDTTVHITTAERTKWNNVTEKVDKTAFDEHTNNTDIHVTKELQDKWNTTSENTSGIENTGNFFQITDESGNNTIFYVDGNSLKVADIISTYSINGEVKVVSWANLAYLLYEIDYNKELEFDTTEIVKEE